MAETRDHLQTLANAPVSAVFVDVENMTVERDVGIIDFDIGLVLRHVEQSSRPIVRRAYADWFKLRTYRDAFLRHGFDQVQTTYINRSKNSLDMQMCVDAMECTLLNDAIRRVYLVTADSDFSPLARAVRRQGRLVIGIGWRDKTNAVFRAHCDDFVPYESLLPRRQPEPIDTGPSTDAVPVIDGAAGAGPVSLAGEPPVQAAAPMRRERPAMRQPRGGAPRTASGLRGADTRSGGRAAAAQYPLTALDPVVARLVLDHGPRGSVTVQQLSHVLRSVFPDFDPLQFGYRTLTALINAHKLIERHGAAANFTILLPALVDLRALGVDPAPDFAAADALLTKPPIRFLGRERQYEVLAALYEEFEAQDAPFLRRDVIDGVAAKLTDVAREAIEAVEALIWSAKLYDVEDKKEGQGPLGWRVRPRARIGDYEDLHFEHDKALVFAGMRAGVILDARGWARVLDGDEVDAEDFADILAEIGFADPAFRDADGTDTGRRADEAAKAAEAMALRAVSLTDDPGEAAVVDPPTKPATNPASADADAAVGAGANRSPASQPSPESDAAAPALSHVAERPHHVPYAPRLRRVGEL